TEVVILENGQVAATETINQNFFRLNASGGGSQPLNSGEWPAGPGSFLTFLPLDDDFDQAQQLTLHRYLNNSIQAPIPDSPVSSVAIFDGYEPTPPLYQFDESTAYVDATGTVAKYYFARVFPGTNRASAPFGGSIAHYFINGQAPPGGLSGTPPYPSVVDGYPLKTIGYDAEGQVVLETDITWEVFTTVQDLETKSVRPLFGAFVRMQQ